MDNVFVCGTCRRIREDDRLLFFKSSANRYQSRLKYLEHLQRHNTFLDLAASMTRGDGTYVCCACQRYTANTLSDAFHHLYSRCADGQRCRRLAAKFSLPTFMVDFEPFSVAADADFLMDLLSCMTLADFRRQLLSVRVSSSSFLCHIFLTRGVSFKNAIVVSPDAKAAMRYAFGFHFGDAKSLRDTTRMVPSANDFRRAVDIMERVWMDTRIPDKDKLIKEYDLLKAENECT